MKFLSRFYIGIIFFILYAPILVVVLFSFNASGSLSEFAGFSLYWYKDLFRNGEALQALKNSLILAVTSSLAATALGTLAAFAIARTKSRRKQKLMEGVSNIPMMNPD
ncbi:MAG: ABC transporter permease, partial [Clostridia bacterium]|nr:ABC transporter permease [Clostridia bacterium]